MTVFWVRRFLSKTILLSVLFTGKTAFVNGDDNIAILRFDGTKVLPHENQLGLGVREWEPGSSTTTTVTYMLVCDKQQGVVYFYAREPLWRIDTASIDDEKVFMRIWGDRGVLSFNDEVWKTGSSSDLWFAGMRTIFADVFGLPLKGSIDDLVNAIQRSVERVVFRGNSAWDNSNDLMRYRSVAKEGVQVVVNLFHNGEIISATRVAISKPEESVDDCKAIIFKGNKPWEIREGQVRRITSNKLPDEIIALVGPGGTSIKEKWLLAATDRAAQMGPAKRSPKREDRDTNWKNSLLVVWITVVGMSIVFRGYVVSQRSTCDEEC